MQQPKLATAKRSLKLPRYSLSEKKNRTKSTFLDSNRIDIITSTMEFNKKCEYFHLNVYEFICSEEFYNIIFRNCYNASLNSEKTLLLSVYYNDKVVAHIKEFFLSNSLGIIEKSSTSCRISYNKTTITIKLSNNVTFEDIRNAYALELQKYNLKIEDIENKGNGLSLSRK